MIPHSSDKSIEPIWKKNQFYDNHKNQVYATEHVRGLLNRFQLSLALAKQLQDKNHTNLKLCILCTYYRCK